MLPEEVGKIERPYQIVLSQNSPAIMTAPDLSKWLYNRMLGLGSKPHNTKLIEADEDARLERGGDCFFRAAAPRYVTYLPPPLRRIIADDNIK